MKKQRIVYYQVDDGTPSGYEAVSRVVITKDDESMLIGRAMNSKYISGVRVNKDEDTVSLLKKSSSEEFYTENHELNTIEEVK